MDVDVNGAEKMLRWAMHCHIAEWSGVYKIYAVVKSPSSFDIRWLSTQADGGP